MQETQAEQQTYYAYAKVNLSLEVLGKRPDGFHELASVMQTVGLYDTLYITPAPDLQFDCDQPDLVTEDNLVWRAALRLLEVCPDDQKRGADIYLQKGVPIAAGLGGGSSDAATALRALNTIWNLHLGQEELLELAAELGSDVPFFLGGGTVLAEGRGERLTPLPSLRPAWLVLLYPQLDLPANKTAELYRMLSRNDYTNGGVTRALVNAIKRGEQPAQSLFFNSFERVIYDRFPQMDHFRQAMVDAGADHVRVSGSGPTLYTLFHDEGDARDLSESLSARGLTTYAVPTVSSGQ